MPRRRTVPTYTLHKPSGQARVRINGRDHYLGAYGSDESRKEYARIISAWQAAPDANPSTPKAGGILTVAALALSYEAHATKTVSPARLRKIQRGMTFATELFSSLPADRFGIEALEKCRSAILRLDVCRVYANQMTGIIRRAWKWAAGRGLVPVECWQALKLLEDLKPGSRGTREAPKILPVDPAAVEAVLPFLRPPTAAMVQLQRLTGMRTGEVLMMRPEDVDTSEDVWVYTPPTHKNTHRGQDHTIHLGPKAQEVLRPFLRRRQESYCFSPREAMRGRPGDRKGLKDRYDNFSYARAVQRACRKAGVRPWAPYDLRRLVATELAHTKGWETARAVLGHRSINTTAIYVRGDGGKASDAMREIG